MTKTIALKKNKITAKDILCLPANLLSKWFQTINPKNIFCDYKKLILENKVIFLILLGIIALLGARIAFMDFDLSALGIDNSMFCGGTTAEILTHLTISTHLEKDKIEELFNLLKPVGIALSVLFWLLMLVSISVRDQFTVEQMAMHFIRLIIPVYIINDKGLDLMKGLLQIGEGIANDVSAKWKVEFDGAAAGDMKVGLFNIINALIPLFLLWIIGLACKLVVLLTCLARRIKLELLIAFAPIALADVTGDAHSTSVRFCKNVLATALQGALILGLGFIAMAVLSNLVLTAGSEVAFTEMESISKMVADGDLTLFDCVPVIAVALTIIGMMPKTEDIARTIIGA